MACFPRCTSHLRSTLTLPFPLVALQCWFTLGNMHVFCSSQQNFFELIRCHTLIYPRLRLWLSSVDGLQSTAEKNGIGSSRAPDADHYCSSGTILNCNRTRQMAVVTSTMFNDYLNQRRKVSGRSVHLHPFPLRSAMYGARHACLTLAWPTVLGPGFRCIRACMNITSVMSSR